MNILDDIIVVKRSGQRVDFNGSKIAVAIKNAYEDVSVDYDIKETNKVYENVLKYINENYQTRKTINVEEIQDIIEDALSKINPNVYDAFVQYRTHRAESRKVFSLKQQHKFVKVIERVGNVSNIESPINNLITYGNCISNEYVKSYVLDSKYTRSHEEGRTYISNLSYFNLGYLGSTHVMIDNILDKNIIKELLDAKTEVNGEISIDDIDIKYESYVLNKFIYIFQDKLFSYLKLVGLYDYMNIKKISEKIDRLETIEFNIDIFDEYITNEYVKNIFINAYNDSIKYLTEYLNDLFKNLFVSLNTSISINNKYSVSISPNDNFIREIIIDVISNLDRLDNVSLIYKIRSNYDIDSIYNLINKNIRLVFNNKDYFSNGLLIDEAYGKSNISYASINLTRLALKNKKMDDYFFKELDELIDLTKNELLFVFETIGDKLNDNYKVLFKDNILGDEKLEGSQKIRKVIKNGTLNINLVGLKECAYIIDKDNIYKVINKLISYIKNKVNFISAETKLNFTLSSIVDKSSTKLIQLDKAIYGIINIVTNKEEYDNLTYTKDLIEFNELSNIQNNLSGGSLITYEVKNISIKKLREIIDSAIKYNMGILELRCKE